jgi:hypothetical protein
MIPKRQFEIGLAIHYSFIIVSEFALFYSVIGGGNQPLLGIWHDRYHEIFSQNNNYSFDA